MKHLAKRSAIGLLIGSVFALAGCGGGGSETTNTATAKIYVIGASYSSDGPEDARLSTVISGDARNVNGPIGQALWIETYATATGSLTPVSSTRTPGAGQSATNFARGGSFSIEERTIPPTAKLTATDPNFICNSGSIGCGDYNTTLLKFPRSAYDQWLAIAATSPTVSATDIFAIDEAENDLVRYYRNNNGPAGTAFINDRADVMEGIITLAIAKGFKKIVIANVPPLHLLPGASGIGSLRLTNLGNDVALLNSAIGTKVNSLKAANPSVQFYKADWNTAFTNAINGFGIWSGVSATDSTEAQNPFFATNQSALLNVKWWDIENIHPSAKLHKYMADNYIALWP
jgi:phospholipase/lecithinase/hemolysin